MTVAAAIDGDYTFIRQFLLCSKNWFTRCCSSSACRRKGRASSSELNLSLLSSNTHRSRLALQMVHQGFIVVIAKIDGLPSSPDPLQHVYRPAHGETMDALYERVLSYWIDENGD